MARREADEGGERGGGGDGACGGGAAAAEAGVMFVRKDGPEQLAADSDHRLDAGEGEPA